MKQREKWYLRILRVNEENTEYVPEWKAVGDDRGHALARLNACKITSQEPFIELYKIKETSPGIVISADKVAVKDSNDGYRLIEEKTNKVIAERRNDG